MRSFKKKCIQKYAVGDKRIVYGCVYEPDTIDTDGAWCDRETLERDAYEFNIGKRNCGVMHNEVVSDIVLLESYIAPCELIINGHKFKEGSWMAKVRIENDELWEQVKSGDFNGFSMGGYAEFGE